MANLSNHTPLTFRPDIEGLRALAILLVVAAHAGIKPLNGGFIGVDVFFVLSGYLITGQLVRELQVSGQIALMDFYARRFRRLLPALLLVIAGSCVLGLLLLAAGDLPWQAISAAMASVWLSNIYFAFSGIDYFGPQASDNLFLHTWSLGVEEQFYLLWPLLLLAVARGGGAFHTRLKWTFFAVLVVSLCACAWLTRQHQPLAFYLMPMRAWQFALGGLAVLVTNHIPGKSRALGWLGLATILATALWLPEAAAYPGLWALLPSLGTALLLLAGAAEPAYGVSRVLAWAPLQGIGRVSYCWYLWHWPVLLLGEEVLQSPSLLTRLALAALALLLAFGTHWLVEKPIRQNARLVARPRQAVFGALALMAVAHLAAITLHNRALERSRSPEQLRYLHVRSDLPIIYGMGCDDWYQSAAVKTCAFGPADAPHTAIIIGDSVALSWFPALAVAFNKPGWRLLVITKSSCPMVDAPIFYQRIGREYTECTEWRQNAVQQIAALKPDVVLLGSTFTYALAQKDWTEGTARILASLSQSAAAVYLLRSTPVLPFDGPSCLAQRSALFTWLDGKDRCTTVLANAQSDAVYGWLKTAAAGYTNVHPLDLTDAVCPDGLCRAELNEMIVFRDQQHLSAHFAESLGSVMASRLSLNY